MYRRKSALPRDFDCGRCQQLFVSYRFRAWLDEKPWAGDGRKRYGDLQLRIIPAARLSVGVRPAVIENVLALTVRFYVGRRRSRDSSVFILEHEMTRQPACCAADCARVLECLQERVTDEGIERCGVGIGACIPLGSIDLGDGRYESYGCVGG